MDTSVKRKKSAEPEIDIGRETRLELYRQQLELRYCEKRAYDLFLQNLIKGTSHLSLGQEAIARIRVSAELITDALNDIRLEEMLRAHGARRNA